jgi:hypothetical protein
LSRFCELPKLKRAAHRGFQLSYASDRLEAKWQPYTLPHIGGRGLYVYGRDYDELLGNFELPPAFRNARRLDPRSPTFNAVTSAHIATERVHDALRFNREVEDVLRRGKSLGAIAALSRDTFLARFRDAHPELIHLLPALRDSIDAITVGLGTWPEPTVLSLDALEGTTFLLALLHLVNHGGQRSPWVVFGPEKYAAAFKLTPVQRPYLNTDVVLSFFRDSARASLPHAAERFDSWAEVRLNPSEDRWLTLREANDFVRFAASNNVDEELISQIVPRQTAAPLNVVVRHGRLAKADLFAQSESDEGAIEASSRHLLNLIEDIAAAGNISNWVPGAQRKLERIASHLERVREKSTRSVADITQLALDGEALRSIYEKSQGELNDAVSNEFPPFFLHLNLLLGQFPAWRDFVNNAERMNWGRGASDAYVAALTEVFARVDEAGEEVADEGVRLYARSVVAERDRTPEDIVGAASSARNLFSEAVRFLLRQRDAALKGARRAVTEATTSAVHSSLQRFIKAIGELLLRLAKENPTVFGWIEHAARVLGLH